MRRTGLTLKQGVSLVEIAIALLVFAILFIPVFSVFERKSSGTIQTKDEMLAYHHAATLMAYLDTLPFGHPDLGHTAAPFAPIIPAEFGDPVEKPFSRTLVVRSFPGNPEWPFDYKVLSIFVEWSIGGISRKIHLSSMRFEHRP